MAPSREEAETEQQRAVGAVANISGGETSPSLADIEEAQQNSDSEHDTNISEESESDLPKITPGISDEII